MRPLCSSVKPQSHTSSLGSGVELSERTTSSKVRSETVDSILSAVAKKKVVTSCRSGADSDWYPSRTTDTCDGVTRRLVPCAPRGATKGLLLRDND